MTHAKLVDAAVAWLRRQGCPVVVGELVTGSAETPDALGWISGRSILVECKASRADFLADAKKPFRIHPALGMGDLRFFLAPAGLIRPDELPAGWGLLEAGGRGVKLLSRSHAADCLCRNSPARAIRWCTPPFTACRTEQQVFISLIRRLASPSGKVHGKARVHVSPYVMSEYGTASPTEAS